LSVAALGECSPALSELTSQTLNGHSVAISREVVADLDTPVSAYLKIRDARPSFLLESVEGGERIGRYSFIGSHPRRTVRLRNGCAREDSGQPVTSVDPLALMKSMVDAYATCRPPACRFEGGIVGYLSYEAAGYMERLPAATSDPLALPDAAFMDVDTVLVFDHVARKIRIVSHVWLDRPLPDAYAEAVTRIEELAEKLERPLLAPDQSVGTPGRLRSNMDSRHYEKLVSQIKSHIVSGDILQAVLSQRLSVPMSGDAFALYRRLRMVSPSPYMYYLDFGDHQLVGASPELLLQVEGGTVTSRPIAGTRPRGNTAEEDAAMHAARAPELLPGRRGRRSLARTAGPRSAVPVGSAAGRS